MDTLYKRPSFWQPRGKAKESGMNNWAVEDLITGDTYKDTHTGHMLAIEMMECAYASRQSPVYFMLPTIRDMPPKDDKVTIEEMRKTDAWIQTGFFEVIDHLMVEGVARRGGDASEFREYYDNRYADMVQRRDEDAAHEKAKRSKSARNASKAR